MPLRPYLGQLVAQLAHSGVRYAVASPGSRSTPVAMLLFEHPRISLHMALDERSAGFFALGIAKASGQPVILLCTSGTAAANFAPAIAEAWLSRIPLIVLTADRPRELRDVGAAQTIDQLHLYGRHVKWFQDLPTPGEVNLTRHAASVARRAVHVATLHPRGPVHLNVPIREPLLPEPGPMPDALLAPTEAPQIAASPTAVTAAQAWLTRATRPVVALGPEAPFIDVSLLAQTTQRGALLVIDPIAHNGRLSECGIAHYDTILRRPDAPPSPDLVIRLGAPLTSKAFQTWASSARLLVLDWPGGFREPDQTESLVIEGEPGHSLTSLVDALPDTSWSDSWRTPAKTARRRLETVLDQAPPSFEGRLYRHLGSLWPSPQKPVLVASSMPIRDLDTFYPGGPLRFYANRGANGIDGLVSTAMGIATVSGDVLAILGDLAFYHDMNGLLLAAQHRLNAMIVIVNNNGGAIFSFLSQGSLETPLFEALFGTPHGVDFAGVATLYGAEFRRAHDWETFQQHFRDLRDRPGLRVLEWRTLSRSETVPWHRTLYGEDA